MRWLCSDARSGSSPKASSENVDNIGNEQCFIMANMKMSGRSKDQRWWTVLTSPRVESLEDEGFEDKSFEAKGEWRSATTTPLAVGSNIVKTGSSVELRVGGVERWTEWDLVGGQNRLAV